MSMRSIKTKAGEVLHVETPNGIVNIRIGLHDRFGREVDSIEILANGDRYAGERPTRRYGYTNNRIVRLKKSARRKVR